MSLAIRAITRKGSLLTGPSDALQRGRPSHIFSFRMKSMCQDALEGLEPKPVWDMFGKLSSIPRPSFREEKVLQWMKDFAEERDLPWCQDEVGNLVIRHPGTMSGKVAAPVIVQAHVDMVTEKNEGVEHDFNEDPIFLVRDGDWIMAKGTTLGADNGVGVATAMAILDIPTTSRDILLPPVEALFTVAEETGLVGAFALDGSMLAGKTLLNLDTEDWPDVFIGCSGGGDSVLTLCADMEPVRSDNRTPCMIKISGLAGGHSGLDIDKYRANAVKIAAEVLDRIRKEFPSAQIGSVMGGDKRNALAREANMLLFLAEPQVQAVASLLGELQQEYLVEYGDNEPLLSIAMHALAEAPEEHAALKAQDLDRLVTLILGLPHGVIKTSHTMDNMVETSNNVASVKMERSGAACEVAIQCATRSSIGPALERVRRSIRRLGEALGATVAQNDAYPGWKPNPSAKVVQLCRDSITETCGQVPELKAIHAGLECGILGQRIPGVECVSFGPTIRGAHSPDERLQISTVQPFWTSTLALLQKLASGT